MPSSPKFSFFCFVFLLLLVNTYAQDKVQKGVLFKTGSSVRVAEALVSNMTKRKSVLSDKFGMFSIVAEQGDTITILKEGYQPYKFAVQNFNDEIIYLNTSRILEDVNVTAPTQKQELADIENDFRKKGVYYKGKPPVKLLSPFGGSPLTFLYELLGRDPKNARRFSRFAENENNYFEVNRRFNDAIIKKLVPIKDEELQEFKQLYRPKAELIENWTDFDLFSYIKKCYQLFRERKSN